MNASASNYHQSANKYATTDHLEDLPDIQRAIVEYMRSHKVKPEEGHHVRTLAKGVQHITKEPTDVAYVDFSGVAFRCTGINEFGWYLGRQLTGSASKG